MGLSIHSNHLFLSVVLAVLVDQLIGDPSRWLHPVQMMGWVIQRYVEWVLPLNSHPHHKRWAGVVLACLLVGGCGVVTWGFVHVAAMDI
jgi:adenosylcobinamide-phosphate synthase